MNTDKVRKASPRRQRGNRTGFTTGACSAAAARAATLGLVTGSVPDQVTCRLPNRQEIRFAVVDGRVSGPPEARIAHAVIIKDAGDDPDATDGAHLTADVRQLHGQAGIITLCGGPGVGTVTQAGLGLEIGSPAFNAVPRRNISENVRLVAAQLLEHHGLEVTISVPGGEDMARRTLNARLGILGGISILGTTGIVRPYSTAAFRASVIQAVDVAAARGQKQVAFTTGGRTEKFAMRMLPELDEACFVQMGDFLKAAFQAAIRKEMHTIHVGCMVGKLTKMCQGLAVTHAWKASVDRSLLADAARQVGAPEAVVTAIFNAETARYAAEELVKLQLSVAFHETLAKRAIHSIKTRYPGNYQLTFLVCDFEGQPICRVHESACLST